MTRKKLAINLTGWLFLIGITASLYVIFNNNDDKTPVILPKNEIEFVDSINFSCVKCGYINNQRVHLILTNAGKVDSARSGLYKTYSVHR